MGLGVVGRARQGRVKGLWLWERRLGARGARDAPGCTAEALHLPHTCNATAMHRGAAALRPPAPTPPACVTASRRALPHVHPTLLLGGQHEARGGNHSPWTQAFARRQGRLVTRPVLVADPAVFCSPRGPSRGGRARPLRPDPGPRPQPLPCQWSCQLVWWPGCPCREHPLAFSHHQAGWARLSLPAA